MAISQINSVVHLCEDTSKQFDLFDILAAAGYTATLPINITQMYVLSAAGVPDTTVPAGLFTKVDSDTVKVDATLYPDRNFSFKTLTIMIDAGPNQVLVNIQVIVDPVNDAPTAEDHTIALNSAAGYVIKESDFGFADPHDANPANQANPAGNNFASVVITGLPPSGALLLNGVAVVFGAEISIADIRAGHLVYQPNASFGGQTAFGFEVRDDGGTADCGASDLSLVHHMVFRIPNAMLGDRVWFDSNANGVQDSGEAGAAGLTVSLKVAGTDGVFGTADDVTIKTTTTDANGKYLFDHLTAGQYQVQFTNAAGYTYTGKDLGGNDATDSDANVTTGLSQVVTLADNETNLTIDAGLVSKASLGDRVWYDTNSNGIQDTGETGVAGVTVQLRSAGTDGILGTADDVQVASTTTNASGNYLFTNLAPGTLYQVGFALNTLPTGYQLTRQDAGTNDAADSDANVTTGWTQGVRLAAGEQNLTLDAGVVKCAPTACASNIYESNIASYKVHLSQAVTTDTKVWVSAIDGTADRTSNYAPNQKIVAGGYMTYQDGTPFYTYYYVDSKGVAHFDKTTGPSDQSWDYSLYDTSGKIVGSAGGFWATIAAGQADSASFKVEAYREEVNADVAVFPNGDTSYKEAAWETFTLNLSSSNNASVAVCEPNKAVCIGDTTTYHVYSPIALDPDGNGIQTTALIDSKGQFDLLGSGKAIDSGWLSSGDAFLAVDANGNGKIDSISELFGGAKGDGFAKLSTYDTNHDGVVNAKDADYAKLLVWQDLNGNHQTDAGELRTLAQAGIASLTVAFTDQAVNQLGNILGETSSATRADGTSITMTDVYFNVAPEDAGTVAAAPSSVMASGVSKLAQLLDGGNDLLDQAFGAQTAVAKTTDAAAAQVNADGGETLRQLLTAWNTHGAQAAQMAH